MADSSVLRGIAPPVVQPHLPAFFDLPAIEETRATCGSCAMCLQPGESALPGTEHFIEGAKCCTYEPTLPNFLVGSILADEDPALAEGQRRIRAKIASRREVSPTWVCSTRKYRVLLDASRTTSFGRSTALLCPYFDDGRCTIWKHREAVCSTFFCKHVAFAYGHAFWRALKSFLGHTESALATWAQAKVDPAVPVTEMARLPLTLADIEDRAPDDATYAASWGGWVGREEAFYLACRDAVEGIDAATFRAVVLDTEKGQAVSELLRIAYQRATRPVLAERLIPADDLRPAKVAGPNGDSFVVIPYSSYDAQQLSESLWLVVNQLRAEETVSDFVDRIRREHEVEVPKELLLQLQVMGIIVPPEA